MPIMNKIEIDTHLSKYGQEHLAKFWDYLDDAEKVTFLNEIRQVDFNEVNEFYERVKTETSETIRKLDALMQPVPRESKGSFVKSSEQELDDYEAKGLEAIAFNEVAVILLAGGQGTRLGVNIPKGMCSVNLLSSKSLYQLQAERIIRLQSLASNRFHKFCRIPWYIMTSNSTKGCTIDFFKENNYFGLNPEDVIFFEQDNLPCLTLDGKIILDEKNIISKAPDGNGGLYRALRKQNIIENMVERGIKYIHTYCVDNILVKMADPIFIGFCIEKNADCAAKVVKKTVPQESVGVICKVNNSFQVVEYSEISSKTAQERNSDGDLKFNEGNICNHLFRIDFLHDVVNVHENELKHHVALKKIPYVDDEGIRQKPMKPNGIKLEKFVFDVFQYSKNFALWEVLREDEFSPLKNATGAEKDTPLTCKNDLMAMHYRWLIDAGALFQHEPGSPIPFIPRFQENSDQLPTLCEISPLVSYAGEGLSNYVSGKYFEPPLVLDYDLQRNIVTFNGLDVETYNSMHKNLPN